MTELGAVKIADDSDFERLKSLCVYHEGWKEEYNKNGVIVWTKPNDVSDFNMVKLQSTFHDISADTAYDVLHDPTYRMTWDPTVIEAREICRICPNSDIGYYAMKLVKPLKNRDFVTQRSWLDLGGEKFIFNHSVNHAAVQAKKCYVRGISYITGYYIVTTKEDPSQPGALVTYITQSDPKGKLPSWAVNMAITILGPKIMARLHKACQGYESWKLEHDPDSKTWLYPEQSTLTQFNPADILSMNETTTAEVIDETNTKLENGTEAELAQALDIAQSLDVTTE